MSCRGDPTALLSLKEASGCQKPPYLRWELDSDSFVGWSRKKKTLSGDLDLPGACVCFE